MSDQRVTGFDSRRANLVGTWYDWPFTTDPISNEFVTVGSTGYKISTGHPYNKALRSYAPGGYFFLDKQHFESSGGSGFTVVPRGPPGTPTYIGSVYAGHPGNPSLADASVFNDPEFYYNEAWNRARPAKPEWSGLNAVFELREVPSMLKNGFKRLFTNMGNNDSIIKKAGEYHVAIQFGWLPLLRDVQKFVELQRNGQKIVKQLIRDNGRSIRRSGVLHTNSAETVSDDVGNPDLFPYFVNQAYNGNATGSRTHSIRDEIRYSGRFKYWLPPGPQDVEWNRKILSRVYGFRLTPKVVYNAIPWTWLADWFSNLGDFIDTVSPGVEDRLASDYFYVTRFIEGRGTMSVQRTLETATGLQTASAQSTAYVRRIVRVEGGSFAPELTGPNLSAMQTSILAGIAAQRYK